MEFWNFPARIFVTVVLMVSVEVGPSPYAEPDQRSALELATIGRRLCYLRGGSDEFSRMETSNMSSMDPDAAQRAERSPPLRRSSRGSSKGNSKRGPRPLSRILQSVSEPEQDGFRTPSPDKSSDMQSSSLVPQTPRTPRTRKTPQTPRTPRTPKTPRTPRTPRSQASRSDLESQSRTSSTSKQAPSSTADAQRRLELEAGLATDHEEIENRYASQMARMLKGLKEGFNETWIIPPDTFPREFDNEQDYIDHQFRNSAEEGNISALVFWMKQGARIDATDCMNYTALQLATCNGYVDIVRRLLDAGANPKLKTYYSGRTALDMAKMWGLDEDGKMGSHYAEIIDMLRTEEKVYVRKEDMKESKSEHQIVDDMYNTLLQCRDEVEEEWKQQGKVPESDSNDLLIFKEGRTKPKEKFKVKDDTIIDLGDEESDFFKGLWSQSSESTSLPKPGDSDSDEEDKDKVEGKDEDEDEDEEKESSSEFETYYPSESSGKGTWKYIARHPRTRQKCKEVFGEEYSDNVEDLMDSNSSIAEADMGGGLFPDDLSMDSSNHSDPSGMGGPGEPSTPSNVDGFSWNV